MKNQFELQSDYYVHFHTITLWERYEIYPPHLVSYPLNSPFTVLFLLFLELDGLEPPPHLQFIQFPFYVLWNCSKTSKTYWYYCHHHVPKYLRNQENPDICLVFRFLLFSHSRNGVVYWPSTRTNTHSKDSGSDTFRWPVMGRNRVGWLGWQ